MSASGAPLRPGLRLRSQVSSVAVVVVSAGRDAALECGGAPLVVLDAADAAADGAEVEGATLLGKRYVDTESGVEVLCTKGGPGVLTCDGRPMTVKDAKAVPSSD